MIRAMRFEKWQALGNDYLIVERAELPFALTPARVRRLCHPHFGPGADGVLELSPPDEPGFVARLRIFNPDGSEAELSGNGAREAILYLRRRGWTDAGRVLDPDRGRARSGRRSSGPTTCRVRDGARRAALARLPRRAPRTGSASSRSTAGPGASSTSRSATRSARSASPARTSSPASTSTSIGPAIENSPQFPNRTNVSFWCELAPGEIRARIFERGVGETLSSGTGACGAAVAHVLDARRVAGHRAPRRRRARGRDRARSSTSCSPAGRCRCTAAS